MKGFTLIELLITVAILGIVAMIAIPTYNEQINKTRRSDAKVALLKAAQNLERCFTDNNSYQVSVGCTDYTGSGIPSDEGFYTIVGVQNASAFTLTATAIGAQASDTHCASFSITNTAAKSATNADCW